MFQFPKTLHVLGCWSQSLRDRLVRKGGTESKTRNNHKVLEVHRPKVSEDDIILMLLMGLYFVISMEMQNLSF